MRKLFISYSHEDSEFAQRLAEDLHHEELVVWIDTLQIKAADSIIAEISNGLCQHDYFVPILSPTYVESKWCEKELNIGTKFDIEKKASVLPVLLKSCTIPVLISDKLYADFRNSYPLGYSALITAIKNAKRTYLTAHHSEYLVLGNLHYGHLSPDIVELADTPDTAMFEDAWKRVTITRNNKEAGNQDFFIEFDVTSYAPSDVRITDIDIEVVNWQPLKPITNISQSYGISSTRLFFGQFKKAIGIYPLKFSIPRGYVKLSQLEMEVIHLTINTPDEGIYDLKVILNYSIAGKSCSISTETMNSLWFVGSDTYNRAMKGKEEL